MVTNRLTFQPVPLYEMATWAAEHRMDRVFGIQAAWLDDDRLGAMLEGLADHQVAICGSTVLPLECAGRESRAALWGRPGAIA